MVIERAYWIAWSQINGMGPILLRRLQKHFGTLATAWNASATDLLEVDGFGLLTADAVVTERRRLEPEQLLQQHEQENPRFWTPADRDYPRLLLETPDPPPLLYYRGVVEPQELTGFAPMVAIVGTRTPSEYGKRWTQRITTLLTQQGFTVVSGLAEGIDTEAHRSCLAARGRTIAVLGCGTDVIYPWSNRKLHQQIVQSGLILSEHPTGTKPDRIFFPRRNRIIAGLCRATLVMEAGEKSGGLITAHYANEYGREVYALPGSLDNPTAIGCLKLISKGAHPILEDELLEMLGMLPCLDTAPSAPAQTNIPLNLEPEWEQILQALASLSEAGEAVPFDRLVQVTSLPASTISSVLLQLEMEGLITQVPGMRYKRS
ncbi:MAG: DNA-protecting protein DprA [Oscillatoriales cyanobacterium C42_A2020_001]|nr:DNA-protecting protein DprA [Leptolyngbyaceae cyanobacterium C42_A2020_001]